MGKSGSSKSTTTPTPYENTMSDISRSLYDQTAEARSQLVDKYNKYLQGNYDLTQDPTFAPQYSAARQGIENQFDVAKNQAIATSPAGGALQRTLGNLGIARAGDVGSLTGNLTNQIANQLLTSATNASWQTPQVSLTGLSAANAGYSNRLAQEQASYGQGKGGMGSGLGQLTGQLGSAAIGTWG